MYPLDRRTVATLLYSHLQSLRKTARLLQVCHTTVSRWLKNPCKAPRKHYSSRPLKSEVIVETIRIAIMNDPFISIRKLQALLKETLAVQVSVELVRIAIKRLGLSKKKAKFFGKPSNLEEATDVFLKHRKEAIENKLNILSIDETSFGRNGFECRGYCEKGKKLFVQKRRPQMTSTTVLACATSDGWKCLKQHKGGVNTQVFLKFLESIDIEPNSIILMDNVRFHHSKAVVDFIASKQAKVLFTPPYSPWFNPIEMCFSIVKRHFRVHQDIEKAFDSLSDRHFESFFNKSLNCTERF